MMRNAHAGAAQSEPEYGASPEAAGMGDRLGAMGRTRVRPPVGPSGAPVTAQASGRRAGHRSRGVNLGGTAMRLRPNEDEAYFIWRESR